MHRKADPLVAASRYGIDLNRGDSTSRLSRTGSGRKFSTREKSRLSRTGLYNSAPELSQPTSGTLPASRFHTRIRSVSLRERLRKETSLEDVRSRSNSIEASGIHRSGMLISGVVRLRALNAVAVWTGKLNNCFASGCQIGGNTIALGTFIGSST